MNVTFYISDLHACGHVRGEVPARVINSRMNNVRQTCKSDVLMSDFYGTQIMVWQRASSPQMFAKMKMAQSMGIKCIYEIDDDLLNIPPMFEKPYQFYANEEVRKCIKDFLRDADAIVVSTRPMADAVVPYSPQTPKYIVENCIDCESWDGAYAKRMSEKRDTVTIGYMGSGSHCIDWPLVNGAIEDIMDRHANVRLKLIGWVGWEQLGARMERFKDRITTTPWLDITEIPYAMSDFDIGIAPLVDNAFNRAKSAIKWMQYGMLGVPCVASACPAYGGLRNNENAIVVGDQQREWYDALNGLVENAQLRHGIGHVARADVLRKHDARNEARNWVTVYETVLQSQRRGG